MKKSLLAATAALLSVAAFAGTTLKDLKSLPAEIFLPEKVTFVEGEDDGDGAVDVTVATDAKVADIVSFLQAKAKEQGLQAVSEEVNEEDAKLEYSKVGADNNGEYSHPPKVSDKARCRRQYAVVRRDNATQYEAFGGWLYKVGYTILTEDGKRHIEVIFLDSRK